jgi:hypothetical protein
LQTEAVMNIFCGVSKIGCSKTGYFCIHKSGKKFVVHLWGFESKQCAISVPVIALGGLLCYRRVESCHCLLGSLTVLTTVEPLRGDAQSHPRRVLTHIRSSSYAKPKGETRDRAFLRSLRNGIFCGS